jgi:hypothetical protein
MSGAGSIAMAVAFVLLIGWRLYRRTRKLIGRQQSRKWRHVASVILLPLLLATLAPAPPSRARPRCSGSLAASRSASHSRSGA